MPCVLIKWKPDGAYHWKHLSEQIVKARFLKTIEDPKKVASGSATYRVMQGETPPNGSLFENGTTAAAWFPFLSDANYRNALFMEQAVSLGRFGYLTLLYPCDGVLPS